MKSYLEIMKKTCKTLAVLLMLCVGTIAQLHAETNEANETSSNSTAVAPPAPVAPPPVIHLTRPEENRPTHEVRPQVVVRQTFSPRDLEKILVPTVSVVAVFASIVAVCALFFAFLHRRNRMLHETVRLMVEKGVAIPPELLTKPDKKNPERTRNDLRRGWKLIGVGVGLLCLAMFGAGPLKVGVVGFIPLFLGLAFVMISRLERKNKETFEP